MLVLGKHKEPSRVYRELSIKPQGKSIHPHQGNQTLTPSHLGLNKCPKTLARETIIYKMKGILLKEINLMLQILPQSVTTTGSTRMQGYEAHVQIV